MRLLLVMYETLDPRHKILKVEPGTLMLGETREPTETSLVEPGNQEL